MPRTTDRRNAAETAAPVLLTGREVANVLRVTERTIRDWSRRGWLHPVKFGPQTLRFRVDEIAALIADGPPHDDAA